MLSLKEFNSLKETAYLLSTENNRKHLSKSLAQAKKGQVVTVDISDLK
jgi:PHD/YefM family antitoxin component YafN of YafNO toxin-antitoxin module